MVRSMLGLPKGQKEASLRILLICIGLAWAATVLLVSLAEKQQEAALERLSSYKLKPRPVLLDRAVPALTADAELADALHATAVGRSADVAAASVTGTATDTTAASDEPASIVEAALTDSSQMLPPETPPVQVATASTPDAIPKASIAMATPRTRRRQSYDHSCCFATRSRPAQMPERG